MVEAEVKGAGTVLASPLRAGVDASGAQSNVLVLWQRLAVGGKRREHGILFLRE